MNDNSTRQTGWPREDDTARTPQPGNPLARIAALSQRQAPPSGAEASAARAAVPAWLHADPAANQPAASPVTEAAAASAPDEPATEPAAGATTSIGRLERTSPEELWPSDAAFAAWLADNLEAIGELLDTTFSDGSAADDTIPAVVARDAAGKAAVFVTERGSSTDEGFGALLRHIAASGAETAIWICAEPRDDHGASISWLNRALDGRFVIVRCSAVKIGGSVAAPMFAIAVRQPRAGDEGVDSSTTSGEPASPEVARRADDWLGLGPAEET